MKGRIQIHEKIWEQEISKSYNIIAQQHSLSSLSSGQGHPLLKLNIFFSAEIIDLII